MAKKLDTHTEKLDGERAIKALNPRATAETLAKQIANKVESDLCTTESPLRLYKVEITVTELPSAGKAINKENVDVLNEQATELLKRIKTLPPNEQSVFLEELKAMVLKESLEALKKSKT